MAMTTSLLPQIQALAAKVFGTEEKREQWLDTALPSLDGQTPRVALQQGQANRVLEVLRAIEYGVYV